MSFKKEMSILCHIAKKLQARQFSPNCLSEKVPVSKNKKKKKNYILKAVLVYVLAF